MNEKKKHEIPIPFKLDDFFTTQEIRDEENKEKIEEIDLSLIDDFKEHPFKVIENEELINLENSIKQNGVLSPVIVRKKDNDRYICDCEFYNKNNTCSHIITIINNNLI